MLKPTEINDRKCFKKYHQQIGCKIQSIWENTLLSNGTLLLDYHNAASAVYSSNIEGNSLDLNSFMNIRQMKNKMTRESKEVEDLIEAYRFAQKHTLNEPNLLKVHAILSRLLLIKSKQGKYREERVGVFSTRGLVYLAVEPEYVQKEMQLFMESVKELLKSPLTMEEALYYASLYHLKFAHIHPFADGNGRTARLFEKWFLSRFLGKDAWKIASEQYYWIHRSEYYKNINLGVNYYELNYAGCLPFLKMLPKALQVEKK